MLHRTLSRIDIRLKQKIRNRTSYANSSQLAMPASRPASQPSNGLHTLTGLRYNYPKIYVFLLHVPCKIDFSEILVLCLKQKSHISNAFDSFFAPLYKGATKTIKSIGNMIFLL